MTSRNLVSLALLMTMLGAPAATLAVEIKSPVVLKPTSNWNLDYAESKCRLARAFGEGPDRHLLFFEQWGPSSNFGMTVAGPGFARFHDGRTIVVRLGTEGEARKTEPFIGDIEAIGAALIYSAFSIEKPAEKKSSAQAVPDPVVLDRIDSARGAQIDLITFTQGTRDVTLQTGKLDAPMQALNACAQDLISHWGLDLEKHRSAKRFPVWMNSGSISHRIGQYYPTNALENGEQGIFRLRVIVDETGSVDKCQLDTVAEPGSLESPVCREMRSAKFDPALDAEGKPMRSFYITTVVYKLE